MPKPSQKEREELPTGKWISRDFDDEGWLTQETHGYGMLDVSIQMDYESEQKIHEIYIVNGRMVARARYLKKIADYSDMPEPDESVEDIGGELLRLQKIEKRQLAEARKNRGPDPENKARIEEFCVERLQGGKRADALVWLAESKQHSLGELTPAESTALVKRLIGLGTEKVHACEIDIEEDGDENTGHLVVDLPSDPAARAGIFRELDRLAELQGFHGNPDDGQRLEYVKLD